MAYPVTYSIERPERYNRWTVFFRLFLAIPLYIVLVGFPFTVFGFGLPSDSPVHYLLYLLQAISLTTILGVLVFLAWFAIMFTGHFPASFLRICQAIFRWQQNVIAYIYLLAASYPPFGTGPYELQLEISPATEHNRATTFFRIILVIPIAIVIAIPPFSLSEETGAAGLQPQTA